MISGFKKLLDSSKGTLSLLVVVVSSAALLLGKLDSTHWSAVCATVLGIYSYARVKSDSLQSGVSNG